MLRHLEQADGVAHGRGIDYDLVEVAGQQLVDREQRRNLGHAGQAGVQ